MEDFEVYTITKAGKAYIGVYVGNQPKVPKGDEHDQNSVTTLRTSELEIISVWKKDQLVHREALFKLVNSKRWPTCVQAWTSDLPVKQIRIADRILSSIVVQGRAVPKKVRK